jgi:hypothetical protein
MIAILLHLNDIIMALAGLTIGLWIVLLGYWAFELTGKSRIVAVWLATNIIVALVIRAIVSYFAGTEPFTYGRMLINLSFFGLGIVMAKWDLPHHSRKK